MRRRLSWLGPILLAVAGPSACQSFPDPPVSFVAGLRVLGIKAEPPEVPAGATSDLTTLAVDTAGNAITATWTECFVAPLPGQTVNPDCLTGLSSSNSQAIGSGLDITVTMPQVTAESLGSPDSTGGVYFPFAAQVTNGADEVLPVYRLRLADGGSVNHNPAILSLSNTDSSGTATPLDPQSPMPVTTGQKLSLSVTVSPDSAESYVRADGTNVTEVVTTSWFCTAGELSFEKTSDAQPLTVLSLDQRLPAPGSTIDLWAVARDDRGGMDYTHRELLLQ
ncbi:MAG TPA: hypothetical protein VMT03_12855 [Polyangia bacterium]|nr:hypothetical protein [Polyangia bacterium]